MDNNNNYSDYSLWVYRLDMKNLKEIFDKLVLKVDYKVDNKVKRGIHNYVCRGSSCISHIVGSEIKEHIWTQINGRQLTDRKIWAEFGIRKHH